MKTKLLSLFLVAIIPFFANSQIVNYKQFGAKQGLSQNYIYSITQSKKGYLWIGTAEGAFKFNGINFEAKTDKQGLSENFVTASYTDVTGTVWLGHYKGSVSKITPNGEIVKIKLEKAKSRINQIYEDGKGRILAVVQNFGLIHLNNLNQPTFVYSDAQLFALSQNQYGYFLGSSSGLHKVSVRKGKVNILESIEFFNDKTVKCLQSNKHLLYIGTNDNGLYILNTKTNEITNLNEGVLATKIQSIAKDNNQNIWVATNQGFAKITPKKEIRFFNEENGISSTNINSVFVDSENNTWLGTYGSGLLKLQDEFFNIYDTQNKLLSNNIKSVFVDVDSSLWLGSNWGITHVYINNKKLSNGYTIPFVKTELRNTTTTVNSIYRDKDDDLLWVGTDKKGVFRMDPKTKRFFGFKYQLKLQSGNVNHITKDSKGNMWFATSSGGASKFNLDTKEITRFSTENGLPHNEVNMVFEDSKKNIWFLTYGVGVSRLNEKGEIKFFKTNNGLGTHEVLIITEDKKGNIWLGTHGDGLFKFDGKNFENYTSDNGLASNFCYSLNVDENNNLWVGSKKGITKINLNTNVFAIYNPSGNSIINYDVNLKASTTFNEKVFFGTRYGLLEYNLAKDIKNTIKPNITLKNLWVNKEVKNINGPLDLSYKKWNLKFSYEGITFKNPEKVTYSYILEGYDDDWSEPTKKTQIQYNKVDYGTYTFKVKACNKDDICSKIFESKTITIASPIWTRWWFYLIVLILLVLIVVAIIRYREKSHREAQAILEEAVISRTKQINEKNEELAASNNQLELQKNELIDLNSQIEGANKDLEQKNKDLDQFAHIVSHDLKAPLRGVAMLSGFIKEDLGSSTDPETIENLDLMVNRVDRMEALIDSILKYSKAGSEQDEKERVSTQELLNDIIYDLNTNGKSEITMQEKFPDVKTEKIKLHQVFANLISNAIKYNDKPTPRVYLSFTRKEDDYYQFNVSDNGPGIDEKYHDKVFQIFETLNPKDEYESTGIGLSIVKKIVEEKGGKIWIDSETGKGTTFSFTWPMR